MIYGSVLGLFWVGFIYYFDFQEIVYLERGGSFDDDNLVKVGKGWLGEIDGLVLLLLYCIMLFIIYVVVFLKMYEIVFGKWNMY